MIYPFYCPVCGTRREVVRPASCAGDLEVCTCGQPMNRVWTVPQANVERSEAEFNYGLGCVVSNRREVREAMKRLGDETVRHVLKTDPDTKQKYVEKKVHPGIEVVEVGNEKAAATAPKPKVKQYAIPREVVATMAE